MIDALSWRAAFWINLPIACAVIWLTLTHVPDSRNETENGELDWLGGLLAVLALGALTQGLSSASASSSLSLTCFDFLRRRHSGLRTLCDKGKLGILTRYCRPHSSGTGNLQRPICSHFSSTARSARCCFCCPSILLLGAAIARPKLVFSFCRLALSSDWHREARGDGLIGSGPRLPLTLGSVIVALAAILLAFSAPNLWLRVIGPIVLMAIGMAIVVAPLTTAVMNAVPEAESGIASAVNNAASRIAGLSSVLIAGLAASLLYRHEAQSLFIDGTQELRIRKLHRTHHGEE